MERVSVKSEVLGRKVCRQKEFLSRPLPAGLVSSKRSIILVHGFNTSENDAMQGFASFEKALQRALGFRSTAVLGHLCGVVWPGFHRIKAFSRATYSARISDAGTSGLRLADALNQLGRNHDVVLVGHSLGCRVVLEALSQIEEWGTEYQGAQVLHAFLLAPAVPEFNCQGGAAFERNHRSRTREHVLYSKRDLVLLAAFPPGQYLYDDERPMLGPGTRAVGRAGGPDDRWDSTHPTGLDHGDYWSSSTVSAKIVEAVGLPPTLELATVSLPANVVPSLAPSGERHIQTNVIPSHAR